MDLFSKNDSLTEVLSDVNVMDHFGDLLTVKLKNEFFSLSIRLPSSSRKILIKLSARTSLFFSSYHQYPLVNHCSSIFDSMLHPLLKE